MLTVIIPAYNVEKFIKDAILTVFNQGFRPIELIIIDDGSTDLTAEAVEDTCRKIPLDLKTSEKHRFLSPCIRWQSSVNQGSFQLLYVKQDNAGPSRARNMGIHLSRADIIAFLDADDLWHQDKITRQIEFLQDGHCDFVFTNTINIDPRGNEKLMFKPLPEIPFRLNNNRLLVEPWRDLIRTNYITTSSVVVKKSCVNQKRIFNETRRLVEDWELWLKIADRFTLGYVPEPLVIKKDRCDGLSNDNLGMLLSSMEVLENFIKSKFGLQSLEKVPDPDVKKTLFEAYKWAGYYCLRHNHIQTARKFLSGALKLKAGFSCVCYYLRALLKGV